MKKKYSKALAVALAGVLAVACFALAACSGSSSSSSSSSSSASSASSASAAGYTLVEDGVLKVATSPDYKPMEYQEGDTITGFDIALINEIADRLGLEAEVSNQAFDSLVTQIAGGTNFDCSISSITISKEREDQGVVFTDPYYDSNLAIVVLKDSGITSRDDLANATVAAQLGSSGEDWVKENLADADYTGFQETPDALAALRTGSVQAVVYDEPVAENHVAGEYSDCEVLEVIPTGEQYGIIVNADNAALAEAMNEQLAAIEADGTMDELKAQYIG